MKSFLLSVVLLGLVSCAEIRATKVVRPPVNQVEAASTELGREHIKFCTEKFMDRARTQSTDYVKEVMNTKAFRSNATDFLKCMALGESILHDGGSVCGFECEFFDKGNAESSDKVGITLWFAVGDPYGGNDAEVTSVTRGFAL